MEAENAFICLYCSKEFPSLHSREMHTIKCNKMFCSPCILQHDELKRTEFLCNICKTLCQECKKAHTTNDHIIRPIQKPSIQFRDGFSNEDPNGHLSGNNNVSIFRRNRR